RGSLTFALSHTLTPFWRCRTFFRASMTEDEQIAELERQIAQLEVENALLKREAELRARRRQLEEAHLRNEEKARQLLAQW
ncbi:hypothetical protein PFISCL1PPCAC_21603, partial [Pristionchus fissidentatus]